MAENQLANNNPPVVLIENLYTHKNAWKLARRLFRMLTSVGVINSDIISISVEDYKGKARIFLRNRIAQEFIIKVFSDIRDVMNFYDVRKVTAYPIGLRLSKAKGNSRSSLGRASLQNQVHSLLAEPGDHNVPVASNTKDSIYDIPTIPEEQSNELSTGSGTGQRNQIRKAVGETSSSTTTSVTMHHDFERLAEEGGSSSSFSNDKIANTLDASTSVSGLPPGKKISNEGDCGTSHGNKANTGKVVMVDVKTSTPQVSPCFCPETIFYHKNQFVGTETRHAEFKQGGVVFELRSFRSLLGRYLCAFLNTEGGVIYFGVTDDGRAIGINVDQKFEDQLRLSIDNAVSTIRPPVPTSAYSVNFAKIMGEDGQILRNLKVLEVCVHPRYSTKTPYSFDNNVYVRRDGSLRTM